MIIGSTAGSTIDLRMEVWLMTYKLIRIAALTGMLLALVNFLWHVGTIDTIIRGDTLRDSRSLKENIGHFLTSLHVPSVQFCFSAILYTLVDLAERERLPARKLSADTTE